MRDFQHWVKEYDAARGLGETPLGYMVKLTEEVGEVARCIVKLEGIKSRPNDNNHDPTLWKENLQGELGDLLTAVTLLANFYGFDLDKILAATRDKMEKRFPIPTGSDNSLP